MGPWGLLARQTIQRIGSLRPVRDPVLKTMTKTKQNKSEEFLEKVFPRQISSLHKYTHTHATSCAYRHTPFIYMNEKTGH